MKTQLQVLKGAVYSLAGRSLGRAANLAVNIILARFLGAGGWGLYSLGMSYMALVSKLLQMGFANAMVFFIPRYKVAGDNQRLKGLLVFIFILVASAAIIVCGIAFFMARPLALRFSPGTDSIMAVRFFSVATGFTAFGALLAGLAQALKKITLFVLLQRLLLSICTLVCVAAIVPFIRNKLDGAVIAYMTASILVVIVGFFSLVRPLMRTLRSVRSHIEPRQILSYSLPLVFVGFSYTLLANTNKMMLGWLGSVEGIGLFRSGMLIADLMGLVILSFPAMAGPLLSENFKKRDIAEIRIIHQTMTRWVWFACLPYVCIIGLRGREILMLAFGSEYGNAESVLLIMLLARFIGYGLGNTSLMMQMGGKQYYELFSTVGGVIVTVVLNYMLIPDYGITGAALSTAIVFVVISTVKAVMICRFWKVQPFNSGYRPVIFITACALGLALIGRIYFSGTYIDVLIFIMVYGGGLLRFGLTEDDRMILRRIKHIRRKREKSQEVSQ